MPARKGTEAHNDTIKAIPRRIGQEKWEILFAFFDAGFGGGLEGIEEGGYHLHYVWQEYPRRRLSCPRFGL